MVYPTARQTGAVCPSKRLGEVSRSKLGHDPGWSEAGNTPKVAFLMIDRKEKAYQEMVPLLTEFVRDLDNLSKDGWSVLVEGPRDESALRTLGYRGEILTASSIARRGKAALGNIEGVVILTDLDREGAVLASRFVKQLRHEGVKASLAERRRLKAILRGIFLHIENLSRFGSPE